MIIKAKIVWFVLLVLLATTLTACAERGEVDLSEEQRYAEKAEEYDSIEEFEPTFLELEYMYSFEVDYIFRASRIKGEFTLFDTFGSGGGITFDGANVLAQRELHVELPEYVELDENSFIAVSIGRRLLKLYYFEESRYDTFNGEVFARPVFEREYYPNTVFVYRVTSLPKYSFINQGDYTDDFVQFNIFNNIPFEVWPYDESMVAGATYFFGSDQGFPFQRSAPRPLLWRELPESLAGYINVSETELRSMPTRKSMVLRPQAEGYALTIHGYTENGEEIDGNSRWYYVRTSREGGNLPGYIHSSFVNIISSAGGYD